MPKKEVTTKKPTIKKTTAKVAEKTVVKKEKTTVIATPNPIGGKQSSVKKTESTLTVALYDAAGKEKGQIELPKEVFGAKITPVLMAQAVRVYLANQRLGSAHTKDRGEVDGSTRKIYQQKGTGRARHGGIRAPIFVGGGVAHGPKAKDFSLALPAKMKRAALLSALSEMAKNGQVKVMAGLEKIEPKTKVIAGALKGMGLSGKKALLVMPTHNETVWKAARNVNRLSVVSSANMSTYEVLNAGTMVVMQEALETLEKSVRQAQDKKEAAK